MLRTMGQTDVVPAGRQVVTVTGNPQGGSRTAAAAALLGRDLARHVGASGCTSIDLADHAASLTSWDDPAVADLKHKASFTGLVKLFLDRFDRDELGGLPTVALMTGGDPGHSLAVEVHLKPVLVEIGASLPTRGIYLTGGAIDDPAPVFAEWFRASENALHALTR